MEETYEEDEKVLSFFGTQLFPAKIIQVDRERESKPYFVHFNGWNKKWDEWMGAELLKKYTLPNLELKKKLAKEEKARKDDDVAPRPVKRQRSESGSGRNSPAVPAKKQAAGNKKYRLTVDIPKGLKDILALQNTLICKKHKLVTLPSPSTVEEILEDYIKTSRNSDDDVKGLVDDLKTYFDKTLEHSLLYPFEKPQSKSIKKESDGKSWSQIYGPEHFLRLFVRLPEFLDHHTWNFNERKLVQQKISEVLTYLQKKRTVYFKEEEYQGADSDYIKKVGNL